MNVGEFPTNFKRKKDAEISASTETLGNAIYDEKILVEGIQQLREGCPGCQKHTPIDFLESVTQGVGGRLRFKCTNKACGHETQINKSKMMPGLTPSGKPTRPKSENTLRAVVAAKTAGMGHTQCNHFLLAMNMKPINTTVWAAHGEAYSEATLTYLDRILLENIEKEKTATLLHEGDACMTSGKVSRL
jgi:hypothetical protein